MSIRKKKEMLSSLLFAVVLAGVILYKIWDKIDGVRSILFLLIVEAIPVALIVRFILMKDNQVNEDDVSAYQIAGSLCMLGIVIYVI